MALVNISISITLSPYESTDLDLGGGSWDQMQFSAIVRKKAPVKSAHNPTGRGQ